MRPSTEQWRQLHGMSREIYGQPLAIWDHHDQPETREEASELLRRLHGIEPEEEPMEETRVCADCGEEKPITEFRKFGRGRMKKCLGCDRFENDDKPKGDPVRAENAERRTVTLGKYDPTLPVYDEDGNVIKEPVERDLAPTEGHWCLAELRDPRLSVVRQAQKILDAKGLIDVSIEDTAEILHDIAGLDLS